MQSSKTSNQLGENRILLAVFNSEEKAATAVHQLVKKDFPMDQLSLLGKAYQVGDDSLGIYYSNVGERMKGWGKLGAFWGGLWGLLSGAAGLFVFPGLGPVIAAGPVVQVIVNTVAGAGITGGVLAGAAAVSQLSVAMHQMGIPEERLETLHNAIDRGDYIVMLRLTATNLEHWQSFLTTYEPQEIMNYPY
jgi:hypothetical protein